MLLLEGETPFMTTIDNCALCKSLCMKVSMHPEQTFCVSCERVPHVAVLFQHLHAVSQVGCHELRGIHRDPLPDSPRRHASLEKVRGNVRRKVHIPLLVTNQPSYLIRLMEREGQPMYKTLTVFLLGLLLKHNIKCSFSIFWNLPYPQI